MSRLSWTSAHSWKQPTEHMVSTDHNHQPIITSPSCFLQVGTTANPETGLLWKYWKETRPQDKVYLKEGWALQPAMTMEVKRTVHVPSKNKLSQASPQNIAIPGSKQVRLMILDKAKCIKSL